MQTQTTKANGGAVDIAVLEAEIARLRAENQALAKAKDEAKYKVSLKVSEKGAVSVYGLGRWPVTLYKAQMRKLLGMAADIERFIVENEAKLSNGKE